MSVISEAESDAESILSAESVKNKIQQASIHVMMRVWSAFYLKLVLFPIQRVSFLYILKFGKWMNYLAYQINFSEYLVILTSILLSQSKSCFFPSLYRINRLRLSVPLYGSHLRKWQTELEGLRAKQAKKVSGSSWNSTNTAHEHLCLICQQRFWLVRFKVQRETQSSRCAQRIVPRESRRTGA